MAVLYEGRQIYFGPKDAAKKYFTDMGYHCPDRQTTADFLTSLTNPCERVTKSGYEKKVPRTPEEFAQAWRQSEMGAQILRDIAAFEEEYPMEIQQIQKLEAARKSQQSSLTYVLTSFHLLALIRFDHITGPLGLRTLSQFQCKFRSASVVASKDFEAT